MTAILTPKESELIKRTPLTRALLWTGKTLEKILLLPFQIRIGVNRPSSEPSEPSEPLPPETNSTTVHSYPIKKIDYPLTPGLELLDEYSEIIDAIKMALGFNDGEWEQLALPLLKNFAEYVQYLPASERQHHRLSGGLLSHSLDVAFKALTYAHLEIFTGDKSSEERVNNEEIWRYAIFVAALMHDIGKPAYDMVISDVDNKLKWNPFDCSIYDWGIKNSIKTYQFQYKKDRVYKKHEIYGTTIAPIIIPKESKSYILSAGRELYSEMLGATQGNASLLHPKFFEIIKKADSESSMADLNGSLDPIDSQKSNISKARQVAFSIIRMVNNDDWLVNQLGGRLFLTKYGLFIAWYNEPVFELLEEMAQRKILGFPKDQSILKTMLQKESILLKSSSNKDSRWKVHIIAPNKKNLKSKKKVTLFLSYVTDIELITFVKTYLKNQNIVPELVDIEFEEKKEAAEIIRFTNENQKLLNKKTMEVPAEESTQEPQQMTTELVVNTPKKSDKNDNRDEELAPKETDSSLEKVKLTPEEKKQQSQDSGKSARRAISTIQTINNENTSKEMAEDQIESKVKGFRADKEKRELLLNLGQIGEILTAIGDAQIHNRLINDCFIYEGKVAIPYFNKLSVSGYDKEDVREYLKNNDCLISTMDGHDKKDRLFEVKNPSGSQIKALILNTELSALFAEAYLNPNVFKNQTEKEPQSSGIPNDGKEDIRTQLFSGLNDADKKKPKPAPKKAKTSPTKQQTNPSSQNKTTKTPVKEPLNTKIEPKIEQDNAINVVAVIDQVLVAFKEGNIDDKALSVLNDITFKTENISFPAALNARISRAIKLSSVTLIDNECKLSHLVNEFKNHRVKDTIVIPINALPKTKNLIQEQ